MGENWDSFFTVFRIQVCNGSAFDGHQDPGEGKVEYCRSVGVTVQWAPKVYPFFLKWGRCLKIVFKKVK